MVVDRNRRTYLPIKLMDKTGEIDVKVWENAEDMDAKVKGLMDFLKTDQGYSSWTSSNHFSEGFFYKGSSTERGDPTEKS